MVDEDPSFILTAHVLLYGGRKEVRERVCSMNPVSVKYSSTLWQGSQINVLYQLGPPWAEAR